MSQHSIVQINGDGIGHEVVPAGMEILRLVYPDLETEIAIAGWDAFLGGGDSVPPATLASIRNRNAAVFGAVSSPSKRVENYRSAILKIRQELDLYANIRPVDSKFGRRLGEHESDFRFVIVRENSEGLYARVEESTADAAWAKKMVTKTASEKIAKSAVEIARIYRADRITIVHKANILPQTDGLFLNSVRQTIEQELGPQADILVDDMLVDTCGLKVIEKPRQFGVIVTTNLYGDILSDVAAYWCGGLQMAPSLNLGSGMAVCEPVHGSAPDIAGQGIADPRAAILSLALLCRLHWNDDFTADRIESAVAQSIETCSSKSTADIVATVKHLMANYSLG